MQSKILSPVRLPVQSLVPLQGDFKTLGKKQFAKLKNSIKKNGFIQPFFVWKDNKEYKILDGHQRQKAIIDLYGNIEVDCLQIDAKDELEAKKLCIYYASSYATFDKESFMAFADGLNFDDIEDFEFPGLKITEDDFLQDEDKPEDEIPEDVECFVELGDVWQLGDHTLMCADSTIDTFKDMKANLMVTDPPYGVELDQSWRDKAIGDKSLGKGNNRKIKNDDRVDWTEVYKLFCGNVIYVWHASCQTDTVKKNIEDAGFNCRQMIIWNKTMMVMGRSAYHWKHEPCWFAVRNGKNSNWQGDRKQTTVWDAPSPNHIMAGSKDDKTSHPSQKPISICEIPIINHTMQGDAIFDPFGGSGSTLIACEKTKRKCFMIELDPLYCSIIIRRWEKYSGKKAIKL